MAVFSTIKNKKNKRLREGIEDLAVRCGDDSDTVDVSIIMFMFIIIIPHLNSGVY